jgi:2-keto-4-pentenoate hydratase/2-oxohepta-3-ene-1,7-dioic acid hydratase in catechol pathway
MRFCSYRATSGPSYGILTDAGIRDAGSARQTWADLRAVVAAGALDQLATRADGEVLNRDTIALLAPIPNPGAILCVGMNYAAHVAEAGRDKPTNPAIFTRTANSIVGHGQPLVRPRASDWFDFEGELAVIIGKPARHVAPADALDFVAGYTCFNDGSLRDYQRHTSQFWPGKSFFQSGSAGPFLVTPDEVGDPGALSLETRLNGTVMQQTSTGDMVFGVRQLIAYLSTVTELSPGDVIATGTPSGVGAFRDPRVWMKPGDKIEVKISNLGILANSIVDET